MFEKRENNLLDTLRLLFLDIFSASFMNSTVVTIYRIVNMQQKFATDRFLCSSPI